MNEEYGEGAKLATWKENFDRFGKLSALLARKDATSGGELSADDRSAVAQQAGAASAGLQAFLAELRKSQSSSKSDSEQHQMESLRLLKQLLSLTEQVEKLQKRYPYGSDIYRTFLNALQVKTESENLLLMPTYRGLDETERRVKGIFRRAYASAYGGVTIIDVDSDHMIQLSGSIHCLTQTIPSELDVFPDDWNFRPGPVPVVSGQR